jgi:hypothetical protein
MSICNIVISILDHIDQELDFQQSFGRLLGWMELLFFKFKSCNLLLEKPLLQPWGRTGQFQP